MGKYNSKIVIASVFVLALAFILSSCDKPPKIKILKEPIKTSTMKSPDTTADRVHNVPPGTVIIISGKRPLLLTFWTELDFDVNITVQVKSVLPDPPNSSGIMNKLIKSKDVTGAKYYYPMTIDYSWGSSYDVVITNPKGSPTTVKVLQKMDPVITR